jgi:hypothetical protein
MTFFMIAVFLLIDGCKDDDSNPTIPGATTTYPSLAGNWKGTATASGDISMHSAFNVTTAITQTQNELSGRWAYVCKNCGDEVRVWFKGTITSKDPTTKIQQISLQDTSYLNIKGSIAWPMQSYKFSLNGAGDTLTCSQSNDFAELFLVKQ